ncbi:IST1-like protein [Tanacetum coccineum]|uniref:IST1-like protein n=1 Tax=Tanacetum coccineum TaxID=301880 RepID=A0ABQ5ED91_9ASTR
MRRDIAKLLETGQEATARIRVEHIIREEKMMAAQEIIELFCELVVVRLPIIETQRYQNLKGMFVSWLWNGSNETIPNMRCLVDYGAH